MIPILAVELKCLLIVAGNLDSKHVDGLGTEGVKLRLVDLASHLLEGLGHIFQRLEVETRSTDEALALEVGSTGRCITKLDTNAMSVLIPSCSVERLPGSGAILPFDQKVARGSLVATGVVPV